MRDYLQPSRVNAPSCLIFLFDVFQINIELEMIQLLSLFYGREDGNPFSYLKEFEEVWSILAKPS